MFTSRSQEWSTVTGVTARIALLVAALAAVLAVAGYAAPADAPTPIASARGLPEYSADALLGRMSDTADGTAPHTNNMVIADLNGDGLPDLLATRGQWRTHYLFMPAIFVNDGQGHFADRTSELFEGPVPQVMRPSSVLVADFNGDGRPDVFIGDAGSDLPTDPGHQDTLILSTPVGKLVDASANLPQQDMYTATASVADVNGDGAPDLFVGGMGWVGANEIQLDDGSGQFKVEPHGFADDLAGVATCHVILSSAFADVDGNGRPDLIIGGGYNPCYPMPTGLLLNDGHGRFPVLSQQFPWPPFDFKSAMAIAVGDVNGDGAPDIAVAYAKQDFRGQWFQLLINDGHGHLSDETATRLPPQSDNARGFVKWVKLVDLNGDGKLDIATSVQPPRAPYASSSPYFLNDGTGHFLGTPGQPRPRRVRHLCARRARRRPRPRRRVRRRPRHLARTHSPADRPEAVRDGRPEQTARAPARLRPARAPRSPRLPPARRLGPIAKRRSSPPRPSCERINHPHLHRDHVLVRRSETTQPVRLHLVYNPVTPPHIHNTEAIRRRRSRPCRPPARPRATR